MKSFLLVLGLFCTSFTKAQTTFEICASADTVTGDCITKADTFSIKKGGSVTFIVRNEDGIGTTVIKYKIYKVNSAGIEKLDATIEQKIDKKDVWATQDVDFYETSNYHIKVYNWYDSFIATRSMSIIIIP
jgi:hypothetical protein